MIDYEGMLDSGQVVMAPVQSILTPTNLNGGGYSANPYVGCLHNCLYCYARYASSVQDRKHGRRWGCYLQVRQWLPLTDAHQYCSSQIVVGTMTDPYQLFESYFRRTRTLLEELAGSGADINIITKSDTVVNDIDLLRDLDSVIVSFSISSLDSAVMSQLEMAPPVRNRIEAMKHLHDSGVLTACYISPVIPGVTRIRAIVDAVESICDVIYVAPLNLRNGGLGQVSGFISAQAKDYIQIYKDVYMAGKYNYWVRTSKHLKEFADSSGYQYCSDNIPKIYRQQSKPILVDGILSSLEKGLSVR